MSESKQRIRTQALAARRALSDRGSRSGLILARAVALPEFNAADTILIYVDARSEVQTRPAITRLLENVRFYRRHHAPRDEPPSEQSSRQWRHAERDVYDGRDRCGNVENSAEKSRTVSLAGGKKIVVPWCRDEEQLGLFHLRSLEELTPRQFGILEPTPDRLADPQRHVDPAALDVLLLPGVAFDRQGGRLGHGRGYFDRLLAETRPDATKIGLAFECQLVTHVPTEPHDVRLDVIVTEEHVYRTP